MLAKPRWLVLLLATGCLSCYSSSITRIASAPEGTYAGRPMAVSTVVHGVTKAGSALTHIWVGGADEGTQVKFDFVEAVKHELRQSVGRKLPEFRFISNLEIGIPDHYDATFQVERYQDYMKRIALDGLFIIEFSSLSGICSNTSENLVTFSLFLPPLGGYLLWGIWVRVACEISLKGNFTVEFYDVAKGEVTHGFSFIETDIGGVGTRNPNELTGAHLRQGFAGFSTIFDDVLASFPR